MADIQKPLWCRLDVNFRDNHKVLRLVSARDGWQSIVAYLDSVAYCTGHLSDGYVPPAWPRMRGYSRRAVDNLVRAGLWLEAVRIPEPDLPDIDDGEEAGWLVNDHDAYQISRAIWTDEAARRRAAAQKANGVRWGKVRPIRGSGRDRE